MWIAPHQILSLLLLGVGQRSSSKRSSTKTLSSLSSPRDLPRRRRRRRLTPPLPLLRGATLFRAGGALRRENTARRRSDDHLAKEKNPKPLLNLGFHSSRDVFRSRDVFARTLIDREMMISPRLANAQNWRRLAVTAMVAVGASAALFARIRAEGDRAHEKLLLTTQKRFPGFEDEEKKRTFLRRGASREERERRVREDLERKRDGSAKVLD